MYHAMHFAVDATFSYRSQWIATAVFLRLSTLIQPEKKRKETKERKKKKKKWSSVTIVDFSSFVLAKKKKEMSWAAINPLVMLMTKRFSVMRWRHVDAVLTRNMRQCLLENATRTIDRKKVARKPRRRWNCQPTCFKKH